jgi:pimeloyl-ACP methyl ester carboxylesterase
MLLSVINIAIAMSVAPVRLPPCTVPGIPAGFLCGELKVPENRAISNGRTISLFVVVAPALTDKPRTDAWVEIAGGPGNAASYYAQSYASIMREYRRERDVLLVDQRGIGRSNGLYCESLAGHRISSLFERWPADSVAACRDSLSRIADLSQYSTEQAAEDLEAVREWLGYTQLNLFTYSYGARAALSYMRRYPDKVRSAILWGVVAPDFRRPLHYARDGQQSLNRLFEDCAADPSCGAAYPLLKSSLDKVLGELTRAPVSITVKHPVSGASLPVSITTAGFADALWVALMRPDQAHRIPLVIHEAARGNYQPLLDLDVATGPPNRRYYNAAHLSIVCAEEVQHVSRTEVEAAYRGTFMPADRALAYLRACRQWGTRPGPSVLLQPVKADVPTLILSGYMDPVTPPAWGEAIGKTLPKSRHLILRHLSHESDGLENVECLDTIFLSFLAKADASSVDTGCTGSMRAPAFDLPQR